MSDQTERLQQMAVERGIIDPPAAPAVEDGPGPVAELDQASLPKVELPRPGRLLSAFARELGRYVSRGLLFRRESVPLMVNAAKQRLDPVSAPAFRTLSEQRVICFKSVRHKETVYTAEETMPLDVARSTLEAPELLAMLQEVERVNSVRLPVRRANGAIELLPEGYDAETRTYTFTTSGIVYDEAMSVSEAVGILTSLTSEFPFGDWVTDEATGGMVSRSQAVVVAGMLTMFAVGILPPRALRPCFIYTSNSVGSGKTLLGLLAVTPVTGSCATTTLPAREEELKKLLDTKIQAKAPFLLVDNLRGHVGSTSLEGLVTSGEWTGRVLGLNEEFVSRNTMTIFLTGNQVTTNEDMNRRSLYVELFLEEADIQARKIAREINADWLCAPANRAQVLSALWALVRSWDAAGRPENLRRLASFEVWARTIGGMVSHAGLGDCLAEAKLDQGGNTEMQDMRALVRSLADDVDAVARPVALSSRPVGTEIEFEFGEIVDCSVECGYFEWILVDGKELSPKEKSTFGKLLKKYNARVFVYEDGLKLRFGHRGKHRGRRYKLARA